MIYIASPYSHPDPFMRTLRYRQVHKYTRLCMDKGETVFSPIVYGHEFTRDNDTAIPYQYWSEFNHQIILGCKLLRVLKLEGYKNSMGIAGEIAFATAHGIPVEEVEFVG